MIISSLSRCMCMVAVLCAASSLSYAAEPKPLGAVHIVERGDHPDRIALRSEGQSWVVWEATWCAPCRAMKPLLTGLAQSRPATIAKVDADIFRWLADKRQVMSLPHVMIYYNGLPMGTVRRGMPAHDLIQIFDTVEAHHDEPQVVADILAVYNERGIVLQPPRKLKVPDAEASATGKPSHSPSETEPLSQQTETPEPVRERPQKMPVVIAEELAQLQTERVTWIIPEDDWKHIAGFVEPDDAVLIIEEGHQISLWHEGSLMWTSQEDSFPVEALAQRQALVPPNDD